MSFSPDDYPDLFELVENRIVYLRATRRGAPKSYVWSDPEEPVRAQLYADLVKRYHYPPERIDVEVEVPRRLPSDFADVVVYRDDGYGEPFLVVECKAPHEDMEVAIRQAWGNANNLRATYACAVKGDSANCFIAEGFRIDDPERRFVEIPERYGEPVIFARTKGAAFGDLVKASQTILNTKFRACHDLLWEGGKRHPFEAFDEMTKLVFCKLQDERHGTPDGRPYRFQIGTNEAPSEVAARVREIWSDFRAVAQPVFARPISVSDALIFGVVDILQNISLYKSDLDAKGKAFETFLPEVFRGDMGQYFTPRSVVRFMVELAGPTRKDKVIDPACGSGGFLLVALEAIQDVATRDFSDPIQRREYWLEWAQRGLFGVDVSDSISRTAMMGMILHEDGRSNIACSDALAPLGSNSPSFYKPGTFTLILTNPPFGATVKRTNSRSAHQILDSFSLGKDKGSQKTEILFIERCLDLLAPGGRMGIVLPDGVLNNPSRRNVREFIERRAFVDAIISLPVETFMFSGATVKSSILFVQRFSAKEQSVVDQVSSQVEQPWRETIDYSIFIAHTDHVGITATGGAGPDELPEVLKAYRTFRKANPLKLGGAQ